MKRIVSVWLPMWPIERMRRPQPCPPEGAGMEEVAFALVESGHRGLTIMAANGCARRQGVVPGQVLADARAALPGLRTRPAERALDAAALEKLATWCGRYGPGRNIEGDDGIWIDVSGATHLFGGEAGLLDDLTRRLAGFGLTARAGLADTPGAAFALARFGCEGTKRFALAAAGETKARLGRLPVEALRLDARSVLLLKRLGLRTIGQLFGLPRDALARRFREPPGDKPRRGRANQMEALRAAGEVVLRLDQALGIRLEVRRPLCEPPVHMVRQSHADPLISPEGVEASAAQLVQELCAALEPRQEGVRRLRLMLYRTDGTAGAVEVGTSRAMRMPDHLMGLLREKLASLDAGFGIDMVVIEAVSVEKLVEQQEALATGNAIGVGVPGELVDRLSNRLGAKCVLRFKAFESHVPELAWQLVPALHVETGGYGEADKPVRQGLPSFLLERPERIEVLAMVPDGAPLQFTWRRVRRRVVKADGPERIAPEWWRAIGRKPGMQQARTRDYYRLEDATGARFWVFRAGLYDGGGEAGEGDEEGDVLPRWFMHGFFS